MKSKPHIAFIGDLTVDRYMNSGDIKLGGGALNSAIWAGRLGAKASVFAAIGDDREGRRILETLTRGHVDVSRIQTIHGATSAIEIFVNAQGQRRYGVWDPGTLADYHVASGDIRFLRSCDAIAVTVYPQFVHVLDELRLVRSQKQKKPLMLINYGDLGEFKGDMRVVEEYADVSDILMFGLDKDTDETFINTLRQFASDTQKTIIITLGKFGSVAYVGDEVYIQPTRELTPVDATGAGDAFLAGFLVNFRGVRTMQKSLLAGTQAAVKVLGHIGAY
jgi:fructoselysine 6-kinase